MSMELQRLIDQENLMIDCAMLRKMNTSFALGEDIDNLVCDTIDMLASKNLIKCRESVDVAYYIAERIKRKFIL